MHASFNDSEYRGNQFGSKQLPQVPEVISGTKSRGLKWKTPIYPVNRSTNCGRSMNRSSAYCPWKYWKKKPCWKSNWANSPRGLRSLQMGGRADLILRCFRSFVTRFNLLRLGQGEESNHAGFWLSWKAAGSWKILGYEPSSRRPVAIR